MTYAISSDFIPSGGPIAASANPGAVSSGGWVDVTGNIWSVDSSNHLLSASNQASPWNTALLARTGDTLRNNQKIRISFIYSAASAAALWGMVRTSRSGSTSSGYIGGIGRGPTVLQMGKIVSGSYSQIGSSSAITLVDGTAYIFEFVADQTTGTSSALTITVYAADGVTVVGTNTTNDTTSTLQNAPGYPATFQFSSASTASLALTEIQVLQNDASASATALTLTGPSTGSVGTPSSNFTVSTNGTLSSNVIVTPSDGASGGTFAPTTVTLTSANTTGTFTYNASSSGAKNISITNNGSLTNPANVAYTATVSNIVPVSSTAFKFSPGNWKGDTGRAGSVYRQSWNNGAWFDFVWTAGSSPTATILLAATSSSSKVSYYLNNILFDNIAANGNITLSGIVSNSSNKLRLYLRNSPQSARWNNGTNTVQVLGINLDSGSSGGTAPIARPWVLMIGDSICEGIAADNSVDSFLQSHTFLTLLALDSQGYDVSVSACGYSGWLRPGDSAGDVPAYYNTPGGVYADASSRWNKIDQGISFLDSVNHLSSYGSTGTEPSCIHINLMTNEALSASTVSDCQASVTQAITALRAAAPNASILIQMPFGLRYAAKYTQTYVAALVSGVTAYQTANPTDGKVILVDFGLDFATLLQANGSVYLNSDTTHPNRAGGSIISPRETEQILLNLQIVAPKVANVVSTDLVTLVRSGNTFQVSASALKTYLTS